MKALQGSARKGIYLEDLHVALLAQEQDITWATESAIIRKLIEQTLGEKYPDIVKQFRDSRKKSTKE